VALHQSQYEDKIAARKLVLERELARIVSVLIKEYDPLKIVLFGSLATGNIHEYSDIDLIVIKNSQKGFYERLKEVGLLVMSRRGADILVYTPEELELAKDSLFFQEEILKKGKVLYEVPEQLVCLCGGRHYCAAGRTLCCRANTISSRCASYV
jgi:predicted nucleotidyltransferase